MPPSANHWYVPLEYQLGTSSVLELQAYPANRANLVVESCQVQLFASVDEFAFNRRLTSANISNANWHNGIAKLGEQVALSHHQIIPKPELRSSESRWLYRTIRNTTQTLPRNGYRVR